jgi:hypothetical protein
MEGLPTCANCLSIARDAKTMGIDVDGPQNDKGLYGLIPIHKVSSISNDYIIDWRTFSDKFAQKRFGFMSQVSPDGKFVVTSSDAPGGLEKIDAPATEFYRLFDISAQLADKKQFDVAVLAWNKARGAVRYELGMQAAEHFRYVAVPAPRVEARAARRRYSRRDGGATLF